MNTMYALPSLSANLPLLRAISAPSAMPSGRLTAMEISPTFMETAIFGMIISVMGAFTR